MNYSDFKDARCTEGENPGFCYRTGNTVYEESFTDGALMARGWNASCYPLDVLAGYPTYVDPGRFFRPAAFGFMADGVGMDTFWNFTGFAKVETDNGLRCEITLENTLRPLKAVVTTFLDGTGMLERYITLENTGDEYINLSHFTLLGGGAEVPDVINLTKKIEAEQYYSVGLFVSDTWGHEGDLQWRPLAEGRHIYESRFGRERYRHPMFFLKNNLTGVIWYIQIAYSGGVSFTADLRILDGRDGCALSFEASLNGPEPTLVLQPGEKFELPHVHVGALIGDADVAAREMHRHMRKSTLTLTDAKSCYVGAGMGAEHDMSMETSEAFIRQFSRMGGEIFIIDAGWECPPARYIDWGGYNGENIPNADRYPQNGFRRLREYCHSYGLKFGVWVEIERLGAKSGVYAAHPEWRAYDRFGKQIPGLLDFTNPEAAEWAENELRRIISEYGLELLRVDYNVSSEEYFGMRDITGTGHMECTALRHFKAVDAMYQRLKRRFPDVVFENCAGGGGRTDIAQMQAFNHTWVSDWQIPPRSALITYGMTYALPPERVDRLFAGMNCHKYGSLAFHMRNTMLTHMSLNVISPAAAEIHSEAMAFIQHSVGLYKSFIRPFLPDCLTWHLTGVTVDCEKAGYGALEISAPDASKAAIHAFTLTDGGREVVLYPRGLQSGASYKVIYDNENFAKDTSRIVTGGELMNHGLRVNLEASLMSELILLEKTGD